MADRGPDYFDHLPIGWGCGHLFDGSEERLGVPVVRHVWELPVFVPDVFEHRLWRPCVPALWSRRVLAGLPNGAPASALGPRLEAHIAGAAP